MQELLHLMERLEQGTGFEPDRDRRTFRIAAREGSIFLLVRPLLDRVLRDAPGLSISVEPIVGRQTAELLGTGDLDLAIGGLDEIDRHLCEQPLYEDRFVGAVWAPREDVGNRLTMEQFTSMPRANYYWPARYRMDERLPDWLITQDSPVRISDRSNIMRLLFIRGTMLLAITHEKLTRNLAEIAEVRPVELPFDTPLQQRNMIWHPRRTADPAHRWLREQLGEIAAALSRGDSLATRLSAVAAESRPAWQNPAAELANVASPAGSRPS